MFRRAGFAGIRSVEFMSLDLPRQRGDLLEMPTTLQAFPQPPLAYVKNAVKRSKWQNLARFVLHGRTRDWTVLAERLLARALKAGGVFHLWGHSWELEKTGQWDQLERVLRLMGAAVARGEARCLTNGQVCSLEPESFAAAAGQVRPPAEAIAR